MATSLNPTLHLEPADTTEPPEPPAPAAGTPRPNSWRWLILGALALVAVVVGVRHFLLGRNLVTTDNAQVDGHITPIAAKVQAFVAKVSVEDNQHVRPGDTLIVLDDRDLKVRLSQALADLAAARAAIGRGGQAGAQLAWSEATAGSATASVGAAQAALDKAAADLARYQELAAKHVVAAQQLDAAQATYDAAAANLAAVTSSAGAAGHQVGSYVAGVRIAEARLAAAEAAVENARLQLGYTVLTAPVDGVVARRTAETGALVQVGQSLMSIIPDHDVWVTANLKETEVEGVAPGDSASITVDAYGKRAFAGRVESLSPATGARFALLPPDNATGNYTKVVQRIPVRIAVVDSAGPADALRPGMSVEVTIHKQ